MPHAEAWSAIVLAAGQGQRMGGVAKPLIELNGEALLLRLLRSLLGEGATELVCVVSEHGQAMRSCIDQALMPHSASIQWVHVDAGLEPAHSLRAGLHALSAKAHAVMVCLADQPFVGAAELHLLLQAYSARPPNTEMVVPWVQDKPGNPVLISPSLQTQWLAHPDGPVGKAWRERHPERVHRWQTSKVNYVVDIDTPHDIESLRLAGFNVELPEAGGFNPSP